VFGCFPELETLCFSLLNALLGFGLAGLVSWYCWEFVFFVLAKDGPWRLGGVEILLEVRGDYIDFGAIVDDVVVGRGGCVEEGRVWMGLLGRGRGIVGSGGSVRHGR